MRNVENGRKIGECAWGPETATEKFRMAPLAWVPVSKDDPTLRPVYKGDRLFHDCGPCVVIGPPNREDHDLRIMVDGVSFQSDAQIPYLTWTPPKVKREGFVCICGNVSRNNGNGCMADVIVRNGDIFPTHEAAKAWADQVKDVIAIAPIAWEEPAA